MEHIDKNRFLDNSIKDFFIRKVFCGRSMRILLDSLLSPEKSTVIEKTEIMETLIENEIAIELYDILNEPFSITKDQKDEILGKIRILFTQSNDINLSHFKISEYNPLVEKEPPKKVNLKRKEIQDEDEDLSEEEIVTSKAAATSSNFHPKKKPLPVKSSKISKASVSKAPVKVKQTKRPETTKKTTREGLETVATEEEKSEILEKNELTFTENSYN